MTRVDDREEFVQLLEQHAGIVRKVAAGYANEPDERRDLMQEIVLQLWRAWPRYEPDRRFSTWMYRIALNVAISHLRAHGGAAKTQVSIDDLGFEIADETAHTREDDERMAVLRRLIADLPALDRALLLLHLDDHDYAEIARIVGITETNVATRLSRIRQRLRRQIENGA
jgi:RNA polymerase sigma-70 factor (ECF subfamily)